MILDGDTMDGTWNEVNEDEDEEEDDDEVDDVNRDDLFEMCLKIRRTERGMG